MTTAIVEDKVDLSLLGNGLDYLDSTVEHLRGGSGPRQLKYAVLHLHAAVEVLLKARLVRQDWSLVFPKPDKAERRKFVSGDFRSIGMEYTITRLKDEAGVELPQQVQDNISRLTKARNKLQHFGMREDPLAIESLVGEVLDVAWDFMATHLRPQAHADEEALFEKTHDLILSETERINALVKARMQRILPDLDTNATRVVTCPDCLNLTLKLDPENCQPRCLFCARTWTGASDAAEDYMESVLRISWHDIVADGEMSPLYACPECGLEALIRGAYVRQDPADPVWACFNCGECADEGDIGMCAACGRPVWTSSDSLACDACWRETVGSD